MSTLGLSASKRVYEIIGVYETACRWYRPWLTPGVYELRYGKVTKVGAHIFSDIPAPSFSELIRALPKMQKATGNNEEWASAWCRINATAMVIAYMQAPTEREGMRAVEKILMEIK